MSASRFGTMFETVTKFLEEMKLEYADPVVETSESGERQFLIPSAITMDHGRFSFHIRGNEVNGLLGFYIQHHTHAPAERRAAVAEFITRVNYNLSMGNFDMDYSDGEITFKASIDTDGVSLGYTMMRNLLYCCFSMMDKMAPAINHVITGESNPEKALAELEAE